MKLKNKIALVTGGSRGIGRAIVLDFIKEGAEVAFLYKENARAADQLIKELRNKSKKIIALKADISDFGRTSEAINYIIKKFKKIDIVVNNASIVTERTPLLNMQKEDWDRVINTNLTGVFNVTKAAITALIKQKRGAIINISSAAVFTPLIGQCNYTASKAGIIGFTKAVAAEVASFGITVNAIAPGYIETDLLNAVFNKIKKDLLRFAPLGRLGRPEEVAKLVTFLASDEAKYITGQVVTIDGGLCLK